MVRSTNRTVRGVQVGLAALVALAVWGPVLLLAQRSAGAVSVGNFALEPYVGPGSTTPRSSFRYDLQPGQTVQDSVSLSNMSSSVEDFRLWGADAYNTAIGGGYALEPESATMTGVGSWIHLPVGRGTYTLPPGTTVALHFSITVPGNATPGDHAGGIVALDVSPSPGIVRHRVQFHIDNGVADAVIVRVVGPIRPSAAVTGIAMSQSQPTLGFLSGHTSADVSFQIENTGDTILNGSVRAVVTDIFGRRVKAFGPIPVAALIPGQRITEREPLWKPTPIAGPVTVAVTFTPTGAPAAAGSGTFWVLPWLLVIAVLVLLGALLARLLWWPRRRRRRGGPEGPAPGAGPDEGHAGEGAGEQPGGEDVSIGETVGVG